MIILYSPEPAKDTRTHSAIRFTERRAHYDVVRMCYGFMATNVQHYYNSACARASAYRMPCHIRILDL